MTARRLVVLPVSPWSERAKWALDHHGLPYQLIEHAPYLGERRLRKLVGKDKPKATVPVLLLGDQALTESWDIALYADREGKAARLIPDAREGEIRRWNGLADEYMNAARAHVVTAMIASPGALDESAPPAVPKLMRPLLRPVARYGTRWFARKHGVRAEDLPVHAAKMRAALGAVRDALARPGSGGYLAGEFSYADILMAVCLQGVLPVDDTYIPLGPATRKVWTTGSMAADFGDLLAWRDRLYREHRRPAPR